MDHSVNLVKLLLNLLISLLQCTAIGGISGEIIRSRPQCRQTLLFSANSCIDLSTTNPNDLGLISADQGFAPDFSNAPCTSNHHIDSPPAVCFTFLEGRDVQGDQDLAIPVPRAVEPSMTLR